MCVAMFPGLAPRGYYEAPQVGLHKVGRTCWTPPIASLRLCVSMLLAVFSPVSLCALCGLCVRGLRLEVRHGGSSPWHGSPRAGRLRIDWRPEEQGVSIAPAANRFGALNA